MQRASSGSRSSKRWISTPRRAAARAGDDIWVSGTLGDARLALEAVRQNVGFLICGLSLVQGDLVRGRIVLPYPADQSLVAPMPYVLTVNAHGTLRPQLLRFLDWLRGEARLTRQNLLRATAEIGSPGQRSSADEPA